MKVSGYFSVILLSLVLINCSNRKKKIVEKKIIKTHEFTGNLIADTIIYDVIIKNTNPHDQWTKHCLKGFHRKAFIDSIFSLVYSHRANAYDFDSGKILSTKEIHKREKTEFKRSAIGKIQFAEKWYFNEASLSMQKKVLWMILGYEVFNDDGSLRGYKPVFKVILGSHSRNKQ